MINLFSCPSITALTVCRVMLWSWTTRCEWFWRKTIKRMLVVSLPALRTRQLFRHRILDRKLITPPHTSPRSSRPCKGAWCTVHTSTDDHKLQLQEKQDLQECARKKCDDHKPQKFEAGQRRQCGDVCMPISCVREFKSMDIWSRHLTSVYVSTSI